jgi:hypothetical protein
MRHDSPSLFEALPEDRGNPRRHVEGGRLFRGRTYSLARRTPAASSPLVRRPSVGGREELGAIFVRRKKPRREWDGVQGLVLSASDDDDRPRALN